MNFSQNVKLPPKLSVDRKRSHLQGVSNVIEENVKRVYREGAE